MLFASEDSLVNPHFWQHVLSSTVYFSISLLFLVVAYKVLDWITPGDLNKELLGEGRPNNQPNMALALVVGLFGLGLCIIIAASLS